MSLSGKTTDSAPIVLRYWGSHFKSQRQASLFAAELRALRTRGWPCHLVVERLPEDSRWLEELTALGITFECAQRPQGNLDWRALLRIHRLCRRLRPAVFHCDNLHTTPLLGAFLARVPVRLWSKRSMNSHFEECRTPALRERLASTTRLSCWLATRVLAVSSAVKNELVELNIPERKIWVRHNPRRLSTGGSLPSRAQCRQTLGLPETDVVIASIGHAVPVKGWDLLVCAFAGVSRAEPRAKLALVGSCTGLAEQSFFSELNRYVTEQRLNEKVIFTGHLGEVNRILLAADLYVSPSRSEGFSNVLIEALEAGLPCVATRVGVAEDVIQPGQNGLLVERDTVEGLQQAMLTLVRDDALRRQLAANAILPSVIPTMEAYAEQMARDYETLLGSAAVDSCAVIRPCQAS